MNQKYVVDIKCLCHDTKISKFHFLFLTSDNISYNYIICNINIHQSLDVGEVRRGNDVVDRTHVMYGITHDASVAL